MAPQIYQIVLIHVVYMAFEENRKLALVALFIRAIEIMKRVLLTLHFYLVRTLDYIARTLKCCSQNKNELFFNVLKIFHIFYIKGNHM